MNQLQGGRIHISGIVQGVGFRPFVYSLAARLKLTGWVRNTSAGVDIEVDGEQAAMEAFVHCLRSDAPPLASVDEVVFVPQPIQNFTRFEIIPSQPVEELFSLSLLMFAFARTAFMRCTHRPTGASSTLSSIVRIVVRVLPLSLTSHMIDQTRLWLRLSCALHVQPSTHSHSTGVSMLSLSPVQPAAPKYG